MRFGKRLQSAYETRVFAKTFAKARLFLKREGKEHSLWCNPQTGATEAVPRHTEVSNLLAKKICKNLSVPKP